MPAPPFLLFDLGGVLVENAGFDRLAGLLPPPVDPAALKLRWLASPAVRGFESGRLAPEAFAAQFLAEWQLPWSAPDFLAEFSAWPRGFYPGAVELLAALRRRHRIGCLSNSNALHWQRFGGFAAQFDLRLSSHLLGAVKPDADCFALAVAACGVPAGQILYFDDAMPNVAAARGAGLQAFHAEGLEGLRRVLQAQGLPWQAG